MLETKPKVEGAKKFCRPARAAGLTKKEFLTKVLGLESHTFDIGNAKYAAKYKKTVDAIANHIQREYKGGADIAKAIKELSLPTLHVLGYPKAKAGATAVDPGDIYLWQQDVTAVKKQIIQLEENKKHAYALVIGQCSPDLDGKLKGSAAFAQAEVNQDVVQLLLVIRGYCCRFDDHQQSTWALEQAKHRVATYYQAHDATNTEYVEHFKALVGVVETYGGAYGRKPGLVATELVARRMKPEDVDTADHAEIKRAEEVCRKCYLLCMLLRGADNGRYLELMVDLLNDMTKGTDNYPKTIVETTRRLTDCVPLPRPQRACDPDGKGLAFLQGKGSASRGGSKKDSASKGGVDCWHCGRAHYKSECPNLKKPDAGVQNIAINDCDKEHNLF